MISIIFISAFFTLSLRTWTFSTQKISDFF